MSLIDRPMFRVEEASNQRSLKRYESQWKALAARAPNRDLFLTYEWLVTWLETFWPGKPIKFLFVFNDQALVALAPMLRDDNGDIWCPGSHVLPINAHSRRSDILCDADPAAVLEALWSYLVAKGRPLKCTLRQLPADSQTMTAITEVASRRRIRTLVKGRSTDPVIHISGSWAEYVRSRSRHMRHEMNRKKNGFLKRGRGRFAVASGGPAVEEAVRDVFRIERNSWKEMAGTSLTADPNQANFYKKLMQRSYCNGWLRIYLLYSDDRPVAHILGAAFDGQYYALKTAYDEAYKAVSPGAVLFWRALRDAFEVGLTSFELLGAPARWKHKLATHTPDHLDICAFSGSIRCWYCKLCEERLKPLMNAAFAVAHSGC